MEAAAAAAGNLQQAGGGQDQGPCRQAWRGDRLGWAAAVAGLARRRSVGLASHQAWAHRQAARQRQLRGERSGTASSEQRC